MTATTRDHALEVPTTGRNPPASTIPRIGIDVGGTRTRVGLVRGDEVLFRVACATPQAGLPALLDTLVGLIAEADNHHDPPERDDVGAAAIGIAVPGLVGGGGSVVTFASNVRGLAGVDLGAVLRERLERPVAVINDANAAALAESLYGAGSGRGSLAYLTISTGIGGGVCVDGRVVAGDRGWAAEFGHMIVDPAGAVCTCGTRGCLETVASGRAIAAAASFALGRVVSTAEAFALAEEGDASATEVVDRAARGLALGITNVVRAVDPAVIVLGGGVMASGDGLLERVRAHLSSFNRNFGSIDVRPARCGDDAGLIGAAAIATSAD